MKISNLSSEKMQSGPDKQDNNFEEKAEVEYFLEPNFVPAPVKSYRNISPSWMISW